MIQYLYSELIIAQLIKLPSIYLLEKAKDVPSLAATISHILAGAKIGNFSFSQEKKKKI